MQYRLLKLGIDSARLTTDAASELGWWSAFGKKRGRNGKKPGPPVHDDLCAVVDDKGRVRHEFAATGPNELGRNERDLLQ